MQFHRLLSFNQFKNPLPKTALFLQEKKNQGLSKNFTTGTSIEFCMESQKYLFITQLQ